MNHIWVTKTPMDFVRSYSSRNDHESALKIFLKYKMTQDQFDQAWLEGQNIKKYLCEDSEPPAHYPVNKLIRIK